MAGSTCTRFCRSFCGRAVAVLTSWGSVFFRVAAVLLPLGCSTLEPGWRLTPLQTARHGSCGCLCKCFPSVAENISWNFNNVKMLGSYGAISLSTKYPLPTDTIWIVSQTKVSEPGILCFDSEEHSILVILAPA